LDKIINCIINIFKDDLNKNLNKTDDFKYILSQVVVVVIIIIIIILPMDGKCKP